PPRRRRARHRPADRRAAEHLLRAAGRLRHLPCGADRPTAGSHRAEVTVMSAETGGVFARGDNPPKPPRRTPEFRSGELKVSRSRRNTAWTGAGALIVVVIFAILPYEVYSGTTAILVQAFIILTLASMWNLLAGYAGLVSVGQQAFLGLGAYFVLIPAMHGVSPFLGIVIAAIGAGVCAIPLWWLVSRLRTGYFAIATWVLASAIMLFIERFPSIGGGTGMPLPGFTGIDPTLLSAYTYWAGLIVVVLAIAGVYFLLRS